MFHIQLPGICYNRNSVDSCLDLQIIVLITVVPKTGKGEDLYFKIFIVTKS